MLEPKTAETTRELEERLRAQDDKIWRLETRLKEVEKKLRYAIEEAEELEEEVVEYMEKEGEI